MDNAITVLIVDDHEVVRQGVRAYLDTLSDLDVFGEAASGEEAIRLVNEHIPDVVLMDLIMPGLDGVETTRKIKSLSPRTHIVVLTSYHEDEHIFPALRAGATSYLLKDMKMEKLAEAVHKAAMGEVTLHPRIAARVIQEVHGEYRDKLNPYTDLTEREVDVLKLIANGWSNRKIAEHLVISENTVKGHVSNILSKLHLIQLLQLVYLYI